MSKLSKVPLTNAERQARRKRSGPRPSMSVTVSRWVQARMLAVAEHKNHTVSEVWETAGAMYAGRYSGVEMAMTLTERGASILGSCTACKREFRAGDRVRRDGEFARHETCSG